MSPANESRYHQIFDASPLPTWISEATSGQILFVNEAALRAYGYTREEFLALSVDRLRPVDARTRRFDRPQKEAPATVALATDREHRRKDGELFAVRLQVVAVDIDGAPAHLTVSLDTAPRDAALAERELRLVEAQGLAHVGSWEGVPATGEATWSSELYRLLGVSNDVVPSLAAFLSCVHEDDRPRITKVMDDASAARKARFDFECRVVLPDGSVRWLGNRHIASYDATGRLVQIRGTVQDITAQRIAEHALVESDQRHRLLLENSSDIVTETDGTGTLLYVSPSVERILGHAPAALVGKSALMFIHPDDTRKVLEATGFDLSTPGVPSTIEYRFRHLDGSWRVLESIGQAHVGPSGTATVIANSREVTVRRAAESKLRTLAGDLAASQHEAEAATAAKSAFLATMSHEIRTPMNAVLGLTELVLDTDLTPLQRRHLQMVHDAGDVLMTLLNDILDLSKIEAERITLESIPISVGGVLDAAMGLLSAHALESGLTARVEVAPDVPLRVRGDPTRLRQVLTNLIGNAVKFTHEGSVVARVSVADTVDGMVSLRFSVRDTGVGIAPDKLAAVFKDFSQADASTTREYGGSGLGLSISRRLVQLMGGELSVSSTLGEGSEFFFTIRLPVEAPPAPAVEHPVRLAGVRALVVDRDPDDRRLVRDILSPLGASVTEASSGAAALKALERARADQMPFAVVLIDSQVPEPDGFALAASIRARPDLETTRILMLTSSEPQRAALDLLPVGTAGFVVKPITRSDLVAATATLIRGGRPSLPGAGAAIPLRILLAEDNLVNQEVACSVLRRRGHHVTIVNDGQAAVAAVTAGSFDLVMMDIHMPVMDGLTATRAIRLLPGIAALPIVAVTADASPAERERCLAAGLDDYLTKPFTGRALIDVIEGAAARRRASAPSRRTGETTAVGPTPPNGTSAHRAPPVDVAAFRATMREADAEDAVDGILDTFLADAPRRKASVLAALESGDGALIRSEAHAFKSSAASIGAHELAAHLLAVEVAGREGRTTDARALAANVRDGADAVVQYLRTLRASAGVP